MRFTRRPSGWSTPSRQPLKPNSRKNWARAALCPHGNPVLPENPALRRQQGEVLLAEAVAGRRYTVTSLYERDPKLLLFLYRQGLSPGVSLRVAGQNSDQTVSVETAAGIVILDRAAAEAVWLRPENE